jgi:hypothetical protein
MYSFNPNLYQFIVDIRRSDGATEVGDANLSMLLAGKGKPPSVGVKAATIVSSGQVIDHELL